MNIDKNISIASEERILKMIQEAEFELASLKPEIEYLEECQKKLFQLQDQKFKLNSLILSLKNLIKNNTTDVTKDSVISEKKSIKSNNSCVPHVPVNNVSSDNIRKIFLPDQAISQVKNFLRTKNNLNYEIYKAVIFNSGSATTQEIKNYLIENNIRQPKTGATFELIELKEISSRINYLVRKGILVSSEPGIYRSIFGWADIN